MKDPISRLCDQVRETSFALHKHLERGVLIDFGASKLEVRKYALSDAC